MCCSVPVTCLSYMRVLFGRIVMQHMQCVGAHQGGRAQELFQHGSHVKLAQDFSAGRHAKVGPLKVVAQSAGGEGVNRHRFTWLV